MASLWDKLKSFLLGNNSPPQAPAAATTAPATSAPTPAVGGRRGAKGVGNAAPAAPEKNPFDNPLLSLSAADLRKRALKIDPYRTAWIGRVDTIPPQTDDRTAIIDRGLILRGLLTSDQIVEIHRVGDLWLKHHEAHSFATSQAKVASAKAVEKARNEKAALKAKKKLDAIAREKARREGIARRRANDIVFLGTGVSGLLHDRRSDIERLQTLGLPLLAAPVDVARALGLSVSKLRWLCFHNDATDRAHYVQFTIPKRSGGTRLLSAPHKTLATAQKWVLDSILSQCKTEEAAHGFVPGRSTVTCATVHLKQGVVVNLDLKDFFPSITFPRVRGVFAELGYSPAVATILALLCTESPRREVTYETSHYLVAVGPRALPQGACTSPALSNLVTRKLDRRLGGMAGKLGWKYSRYADDLTFSAPKEQKMQVALIMARARHIVSDENFTPHPDKVRVQHASRRQTVTGIVVNDRPGLPREEVRRLRAILHNAATKGLESQNRESHPHFESWLRGKIAYLAMIDPVRGAEMLTELDGLVGRTAT